MQVRFLIAVMAFLSLAACSISSKRGPSQDPKVILKDGKGQSKEAPAQASSNETKELTPVQIPEGGAQEAQEMKEAVAAAAQHIHSTHQTAQPGQHREVGPVPAEKSLGWLKNGNTRFVRGRFRSDGTSPADIKRLSVGQKPHAVVLSCSDSRVPPEILFDQKLGEIFVVRTAGQALNDNVIGSIEYGVQHLGANLVVVMGHDSCGAVRATLEVLQEGGDMGSPALNNLVADLKPRLQKYATLKPTSHVEEESWSNVNGVARDLLERSAILRDALQSGEVRIEKALYHMDSGKVDWR